MNLSRIPILGRFFLPERNGTTFKRTSESEQALLDWPRFSSASKTPWSSSSW
jgi:hypothetical protein